MNQQVFSWELGADFDSSLSHQAYWVTGLRSGPCVRPYGAGWAQQTRRTMSRRPASMSSSWRGGRPSRPGCPAEPPPGWRRRWRWRGRAATQRPSSATWLATASVRHVDWHRRKVRFITRQDRGAASYIFFFNINSAQGNVKARQWIVQIQD